MKNLKHINLVEDIITAVNTNHGANLIKALYKVKQLPLIIQYYLIKGLKEANINDYDAIFALERTYALTVIMPILNELYNFQDHDDSETEKAAYDGMGNLDAYITAIKAL